MSKKTIIACFVGIGLNNDDSAHGTYCQYAPYVLRVR